MLYAIALSVIVGALGLYYFLFKDLHYFKKRGIPYAKPLPLLGNTGTSLFRLESMAEIVKTIYNVHPDAKYIGMYDVLNKPLISIRDPELIKLLILKHFESFPQHRNFFDESYDPLLGKTLFSLHGERWRETRAILSPSFTSSKMKNMFKLMSDCGVNFTNYLSQLPSEQRTMNTKDVFTRYTNDMIASCAFGISVDSMRNPKNQFYLYGKEMSVFGSVGLLKFYVLKYLPWPARMLRLRIIREEVANFFRDLIKSTIMARDENNIVRPDMLQLMMESRGKEDKSELTNEDMTSQAVNFFFGGFESTSTLMCFASHEIAVNPDIREKLQREIDRVLENTNGQAPYDAVNDMEYLEAVIYEALRRYPIVVGIDRLCVNDFELPPTLPGMKPFTIKKGQGIFIPIYGLHHDPKYFEDPERFDPERFVGERKKASLNCGAYLPFGLGPRICIGNRFALLETKVLLFHLLARCDLIPCEKMHLPLKLAKDGFNMKAEGGFWLKILPRKNPHRTVAIDVTTNGTRKS